MKIDWWMILAFILLTVNAYIWMTTGEDFNAFATGVLLMVAADRLKSYA